MLNFDRIKLSSSLSASLRKGDIESIIVSSVANRMEPFIGNRRHRCDFGIVSWLKNAEKRDCRDDTDCLNARQYLYFFSYKRLILGFIREDTFRLCPFVFLAACDYHSPISREPLTRTSIAGNRIRALTFFLPLNLIIFCQLAPASWSAINWMLCVVRNRSEIAFAARRYLWHPTFGLWSSIFLEIDLDQSFTQTKLWKSLFAFHYQLFLGVEKIFSLIYRIGQY